MFPGWNDEFPSSMATFVPVDRSVDAASRAAYQPIRYQSVATGSLLCTLL